MSERPNSKRWIDWDGSTWIALVAWLTAVTAVWFQVSDRQDQREHDRMSTQPRISVSYFQNLDGAGYVLNNGGLGPGRLEWFKARVDGEPVYTWQDLVCELGIQPFGSDYEFAVPGAGGWLKNSVQVLWIDPKASQALKQQWQRIEIEACYCSIYEQCWTGGTKKSMRRRVASCDDSAPVFTFTNGIPAGVKPQCPPPKSPKALR